MNFIEAEEYYNILSGFSIYKEEFDTYKKNSYGYFGYVCQDVTSDISENKEDYTNICLDVLNYKMYMKNQETLDSKRVLCMFLNYLLNNYLHRIKHNKYNASTFYSKIRKNYKSSNMDFNICHQEIKDIHNFVIYTVETLFNLHYNLYKYRISILAENLSHCPYAHNFASIYNNFKNVCAAHYSTSFCQKIIKIKDEYNEYIKSEDKCANVEKDLKNPEKIESSNILQVSGPYGSSLDEHHMLGNTSNPMGNNISVPFAILLVTPFLLFILYKFTPLGLILRPHLHKYLGISGNNNEKNHKLHSNNFTDDETETHNSGYHITYNSLAQ
ncbi:PIR protein [Plasmodium ovale]|uniref:PIR protein n=2 Tax=Plasmodium ovale TaxID=36330 RepID=A0A1D3KWK3_PLAOA|nr:PIR protein [Plasmodium ovale]